MRLVQHRIDVLADRLVERGLTDRRRRHSREVFETVYDITRDNAIDRLEILFRMIIQARSSPLTDEEYDTIIDEISPQDVMEMGSHHEAFDSLRSQKHIGQKIANEFLRHTVDVFGIKPEWRDNLEVALDTHVVQALVKTGGIDMEGSEKKRPANGIINMNPDSTPRKLIGYQDAQDGLMTASEEAGMHRIDFDELWIEHRYFMSDPLLQSESAFYDDLILEEYL